MFYRAEAALSALLWWGAATLWPKGSIASRRRTTRQLTSRWLRFVRLARSLESLSWPIARYTLRASRARCAWAQSTGCDWLAFTTETLRRTLRRSDLTTRLSTARLRSRYANDRSRWSQ